MGMSNRDVMVTLIMKARNLSFVVNSGLGGLTSIKLCLGRHEWVETLSPLCLELNLG